MMNGMDKNEKNQKIGNFMNGEDMDLTLFFEASFFPTVHFFSKLPFFPNVNIVYIMF